MPVSVYFHAGEPHQFFSDSDFGLVLFDSGLAIACDGASLVCQRVTMQQEPDPSARADWTWLANKGGASPEAIAEVRSYKDPLAIDSNALKGLMEPVYTEMEDGTFGTAFRVTGALTLTPEGAVVAPTEGSGETATFPYEEAREIDLKTVDQWQKFVPSNLANRLQITLDARKLEALATAMGPDGLVTLSIGGTAEPVIATCPGNQEALGVILPVRVSDPDDLVQNEIFKLAQARKEASKSQIER